MPKVKVPGGQNALTSFCDGWVQQSTCILSRQTMETRFPMTNMHGVRLGLKASDNADQTHSGRTVSCVVTWMPEMQLESESLRVFNR